MIEESQEKVEMRRETYGRFCPSSGPGKHLHIFMLISYLVYSSTLKMETIYSSETLVDFHRTILRMSQKTDLYIGTPVGASDATR
jgi:hypothetical protein